MCGAQVKHGSGFGGGAVKSSDETRVQAHRVRKAVNSEYVCPSQIKKEKTGVHNVSTTPYALIVNNVVHINVLHRARAARATRNLNDCH